MFPKV